MPRRNYNQARPGQVYASEWPEWHVDCAEPGCEESVVVAGCGEAYTARAAEQQAAGNAECDGWRKRGGLWYCPRHA